MYCSACGIAADVSHLAGFHESRGVPVCISCTRVSLGWETIEEWVGKEKQSLQRGGNK